MTLYPTGDPSPGPPRPGGTARGTGKGIVVALMVIGLIAVGLLYAKANADADAECYVAKVVDEPCTAEVKPAYYLAASGAVLGIGALFLIVVNVSSGSGRGAASDSPPGQVLPTFAAQAPQAGDTKTCPYCAEEIRKAATVCRYCGRHQTVP